VSAKWSLVSSISRRSSRIVRVIHNKFIFLKNILFHIGWLCSSTVTITIYTYNSWCRKLSLSLMQKSALKFLHKLKDIKRNFQKDMHVQLSHNPLMTNAPPGLLSSKFLVRWPRRDDANSSNLPSVLKGPRMCAQKNLIFIIVKQRPRALNSLFVFI